MFTSVRVHLATASPGRRLAVAALACVTVLMAVIAGSAAVIRASAHSGSSNTSTAGRVPAGGAAPAPPASASSAGAGQAAVAADVAALTAMPNVPPAASRTYPPVPAADRAQPDLYAAAVTTELLTRDYRTDRADLLGWVQAESAPSTEPLVVGLVPTALRPKLAVWSATSGADADPAPIPSPADWASWRQHYAATRVQIVRVSEPVAWAAAVTGGKLTDPGITARDVEATLTTSWRDSTGRHTSTASVTLSLNLEGPPTRAGYGLVDIAGYATAAAVS